MLRITTTDNPRMLLFRLEGRLEGPWVGELKQCWCSALARPNRPTICVALAGKARLAEMHAQGAQFVNGDCLTTAIVAEIVEDASRAMKHALGDSV